MASVGTIRLFLAYHTAYIMSYNLHVICEGCLAKVANAKGVSVPAPLAQHPTDDLAGKFAPAHPTCQDPVWPRFPAVTAYLSGAPAEPLQLKAPVSTFTPIMRVESLTDQGFPPVPALETSLSAVFGVRSARCVGRRPVPLSSSDQIMARLTDRSHQCAAQVAAATNTPPSWLTPFLRRLGRWSCHRKMWRNSATLRTPSLTFVRCRLCAPPASLPGRPCYSDRCGLGSPPPFPRIL
ncbi:hypothetical protein GOODEAATRI_027712 [Goodea atripinnis]|uniref:Uncharacterized protein n=1 Tax=Goodea atripinnis TaxID=208336 RepID=A0ABV0N661_9TELE